MRGELYDKIVRSIFSGDWKTVSGSQAINYWWGMASGVLDVKLSDLLPDGVQSLGQILKEGICDGSIQPFRTRIFDQHGELRNDGSHTLSPEEILSMDCPVRYRNKVQYLFRWDRGRVRYGLYRSSDGGLVTVDDCMMEDKEAAAVCHAVRRMIDKYKITVFDGRKGLLRHVMARRARSTGEIVCAIVTSPGAFHSPFMNPSYCAMPAEVMVTF